MKKSLLLCIILLALQQVAPADQVWVKNQPFQGIVRGSGTGIQVELRTILKTLELQAEDQGDTVVVGGFPIPVEDINGVRMVLLRDLVDAAGLRMHSNPDLGTIDVRAARAGEGSRGDWAGQSATQGSSESVKGTKTLLDGDFFRLTVPANLEVLANPRYLKSGESANARALPQDALYSPQLDAEILCTARKLSGIKDGYLLLAVIHDIGGQASLEEQRIFAEVVRESATSHGAQDVSDISSSSLAGKRFFKFSFQESEDGVRTQNEVYLHFSGKHNKAFMVTMKAPTKIFKRVFPQLRLVVTSLQIK